MEETKAKRGRPRKRGDLIRFSNASDYPEVSRLLRAWMTTLQPSQPNLQKVDEASDELIAFINKFRGV